MTDSAFDRMVEEGFERLPEWVRNKIRNVALLVEDEPTEEIRRSEDLGEDETLLGYYQGIPLSERGSHYGEGMVLPDTVTLYRLPILEAAEEDGEDVRDVIADTIWHEYAHHFGTDERGVQMREKSRHGHS